MNKFPEIATLFVCEHSKLESFVASGQLDLPGKVDLTSPAHWESFRAEAEVGQAVLDSACNRTMMGGNNLPALNHATSPACP